MAWIIPTEKLLTGVSICNSLETENYRKLLEFGYLNAFGTDDEKEKKLEELQNIESLLQMGKQLNLAIKTVTYLLRLMLFIASPDIILLDLTEKLQMEKEKSELLIKYWMSKTKSVLDGVCPEKELVDVQWDMKVELSSSTQQKSKTPIGILRLKTADTKKLNLEMNTDEIVTLFDALENVQEELDLLKQSTSSS